VEVVTVVVSWGYAGVARLAQQPDPAYPTRARQPAGGASQRRRAPCCLPARTPHATRGLHPPAVAKALTPVGRPSLVTARGVDAGAYRAVDRAG